MRNDLMSDRRRAVRVRARPPLRLVLLGALLAVLAGALGWYVYDAFIRSDEDKIRGLILAVAQAARERRPSGVTACLAPDFVFRGPPELNRDEAHRVLVQVLWREFREIEVGLAPDPIPVTVSPDRGAARAQFHARVRGKWTEDSEWVELNTRVNGRLFVCTFKLCEKVWKLSEVAVRKE